MTHNDSNKLFIKEFLQNLEKKKLKINSFFYKN